MTIYTKARVGTTFLEEVDAPLRDTLSAAFEEAWNTNPLVALERETELREAMEGPFVEQPSASFPPRITFERTGEVDSPIVSAEDARLRVQEAGLDLVIPDEGIPQRALEILMERKRAERMRADAYSRGPSGFVPGALRLGVALGASILDPLNIASGFIPVVGPARYSAMLARASGPLGRAGVRLGVGAAEGTVGAAVVEPFILNAMRYEQADYDTMDSLLNIALGGALGGGLHVIGGGVVDVVQGRRAAGAPPPSALQQGIEAASPETREAVLRTAVAQMVEGRNISVESVAFLDPVVRAARDTPEAFSSDVGWRARMELEDEARLTQEAAGPSGEGVPFVITQGDRQRLSELGYTDEAVRNLRPEQARDILQDQLTPEQLRTRAAEQWDSRLSAVGRREALADAGVTDARLSRRKWKNLDEATRERLAPVLRPLPEPETSPRLRQSVRETARQAAAGPVDQKAWAQVVSDAQTGGLQPSALADAAAARQADEALKATAKADTPEGIEAEAQAAFDNVKELAEALGDTRTLDVLTKEADEITAEAETLGRAAKALASCQLRRGVSDADGSAATTVARATATRAARTAAKPAARAAAKAAPSIDVNAMAQTVRAAMGNPTAFSAVMRDIGALSAADARALAKAITTVRAPTKARALRDIQAHHNFLMSVAAKRAATAGRSAG